MASNPVEGEQQPAAAETAAGAKQDTSPAVIDGSDGKPAEHESGAGDGSEAPKEGAKEQESAAKDGEAPAVQAEGMAEEGGAQESPQDKEGEHEHRELYFSGAPPGVHREDLQELFEYYGRVRGWWRECDGACAGGGVRCTETRPTAPPPFLRPARQPTGGAPAAADRPSAPRQPRHWFCAVRHAQRRRGRDCGAQRLLHRPWRALPPGRQVVRGPRRGAEAQGG